MAQPLTLGEAQHCVHSHPHVSGGLRIVLPGVVGPLAQPDIGPDSCCVLAAIQEADEEGQQWPHSLDVLQEHLELHLDMMGAEEGAESASSFIASLKKFTLNSLLFFF